MASLKKRRSGFRLFVADNRVKFEPRIAPDAPDKRDQLKKLLTDAYGRIDATTRKSYEERASVEQRTYDEALSKGSSSSDRDVIDLISTSEDQNASSQGSKKKDFFSGKSNKVKENSPNDGTSSTNPAGQLELQHGSSSNGGAKKSNTYNYGNNSSKEPRKFASLKEMQNKDKGGDKDKEKEKNGKKAKTSGNSGGSKATFFMTPSQKQEIEERKRKEAEARKQEEEQRLQQEKEQRLLQSFQEEKERRRRESKETFTSKGEGVNKFFTGIQEKINTAAITKKNAGENSISLISGEDHVSSKPILFPEMQNINLPEDSTLLDKYLGSSVAFSGERKEKIVSDHRDSLYHQSQLIDLSESAGESPTVMAQSLMVENNNNVYAYTRLKYQHPESTLRETSMMDITPSELHCVISIFMQATGLSSDKMIAGNNEKEGVIDVDDESNDLIMSTVNNEATPTKSLASFYDSNESLVDFHRPRSSTHLFGNEDNIQALRQWLEYWAGKRRYSKLDRNMKGKSKGKRKSRYDDDEGDDAWGDDDEDQACNVACVMGPTGVGKTSAVYALAEELGFNIIEITASELRSGAAIKKQFQEAAKSHGLKLNDAMSEKGKKGKESKKEGPRSGDSNSAASSLNVILFDEVDLEFEADKGMSSEILQMVKSTRTPIILTAEREDLPILRQIECLGIYWDGPSNDNLEDLCRRVLRPMPAMKNIFAKMSKLLSYTFDGDVRKLLNSLQLWLPTLQCRADTETYGVEENVLECFERWLADTRCSSVYQDQMGRYLKYAIEDSSHFSSHASSISSNGGNLKGIYQNGVYVPILSSIEPNKGSWRGGFKVRIFGRHFLQKDSSSQNNEMVKVKILLQGLAMPADHVSILSDDEIEIRIPRDTPSGVHSVVVMLTCQIQTAEGLKMWTTKSDVCGGINGYVFVEHPFNKKTLPQHVLGNSAIRRKPRKLGENDHIDSSSEDDVCEVEYAGSNRKRFSDVSYEEGASVKKRKGSLKAKAKKDISDDEDELHFSDIEDKMNKEEDITAARASRKRKIIIDDDEDVNGEEVANKGNNDGGYNDMVIEEGKSTDLFTKSSERSGGLDKFGKTVFDMVESMSHEDIKPMMRKAIEMVSKYAMSSPFEHPVSKDDAPDYTMVIKTPMDIGTVRRKVSANKYTSLHAYICDVRLIWSNCLEYNQNDRTSAFLKYDAKVLCNAFEEYLQEKLVQVVQKIMEAQYEEKVNDVQSVVDALHTKRVHADVDEKDMITYGILSEPLEKSEEVKVLASLLEAESKRTNALNNKRNFSISPGLEYLNPQSSLIPTITTPLFEIKDTQQFKRGSAINVGTCHALHTLSQISKQWSDAEVLGRFAEFNGSTSNDSSDALREEHLRDTARPMVSYLRGNSLSTFVESELDTMKNTHCNDTERKETIMNSYMGMLSQVQDRRIDKREDNGGGSSESTASTCNATSSIRDTLSTEASSQSQITANEKSVGDEDEEAEFGDDVWNRGSDGEDMEVAHIQEVESIVLQKLKFKKLFDSGSLASTRRHKMFGQFVTEIGWQTAEDDAKRSLKTTLFDNSHYLNSKVSHALSVDVYPMVGKMVELEQQSDKVSISSSRRHKVTSKYPDLYEKTGLPEQHLDAFLRYTRYSRK